MYKITYIHKYKTTENDLYIPGDQDYCLTKAKLSVGMGTSGTLTLGIPDENPSRADIVCLTDEVIVYRNEKEIWRGRPITVQIDFNLTGTLTCEGILSYLYDTYYEPFEFEGSPNDLLEDVIENHNSKVDEQKQFKIGEITVTDPNDYINRSSIYYNRTLTVLKEKFIEDSLGGYFRVRVEDDGRYLDYLTAYNTQSDQPIRYGYNLLDIAQNIEFSDVATVVLPLGARLKDEDGFEADERLTVASVNSGNVYIEDRIAVETYGWIAVEAEWDDVTLPTNLYEKGRDYLTQVTSPISRFTIKAVDLSLVDKELDPINLGDFVLIRVDSHNVNQMVELTGMDIDILDPANSILTFGTDAATLTGMTNNTQRSIQESLGSLDARFTNLSTNVLNAVYANIENIVAGMITVDLIRAAVADMGFVTIDYLVDNYASIRYLEANYASIVDLQAISGTVTLLDSDVANIINLLAGNAGVGDLEAIYLTTANAIIDEAVITEALINTVLADIITSNIIYTDNITIMSEDGGIVIAGTTMQFSDENGTVRLQLGQDADGNFTFVLYDETGAGIMIDSEGIHESAVPDGLIVDSMVAEEANISGYKLNIEEVTSILNEQGQLILNAAQVTIDGETLDYRLTQITQELSEIEMEGIESIENYYALGGPSYPPCEPGETLEGADDKNNAILGKMILGYAVLGYTSSSNWVVWTTERLTPNDTQYLWFCQKITYVDGTVVWTTPTLLTDEYIRETVSIQQTELEIVQGQIQGKIWLADIETAVNEVGEQIETIYNQYGILTVLIDTIDARVAELTTTVGDNYSELYSLISSITIDLSSITARVEEVEEKVTDDLSDMSEKYSELILQVDSISGEVLNVQADIAENYSTTTEIMSVITGTVSDLSSEILQEVSYIYVDQEELADSLAFYYTGETVDALISASARSTSAEILQTVSYTYATTQYVKDVLDDIELNGIVGMETYYAVSKSAEEPYAINYILDCDFSDGECPSGLTEYNSSSSAYGEIDYSGSDLLGPCAKVTNTSSSGRIGFSFTSPFRSGTFIIEFDAATESGYESSARISYGYINNLSSSAPGDLSSIKWTHFKYEYDIQSYSIITFVIATYSGVNAPILLSNIKTYMEGDEIEPDWSPDKPDVPDDEYLWVRYRIKYVDGHTEWTDAICIPDDLSLYSTTAQMTATIQQYVDDSMAKITLTVSGGLGDTASIVMTAGDNTTTQTLNLRDIRQAFANDSSEIDISAGSVNFYSGTFSVNSNELIINADGSIVMHTPNYSSSVNYDYEIDIANGSMNCIYRRGGTTYYGYPDIDISGNAIEIRIGDDYNSSGGFHIDYGYLYGVVYGGADQPWLNCNNMTGQLVTGYSDNTDRSALLIYGRAYINGELITASDENIKNDLKPISDTPYDCESLFDTLEVETFKYKNGGDKTHIGLTYQNVVKALETAKIDPDSSALVSSIENEDGEKEYGVAYNNIVALLIYEVQQLKKQVNSLTK